MLSHRGGWSSPFKAIIRTSDQIWFVSHQLTSRPVATPPSPSLPHDWHSLHSLSSSAKFHRSPNTWLCPLFSAHLLPNGHPFTTSVPKLPHKPPLTPSKCHSFWVSKVLLLWSHHSKCRSQGESFMSNGKKCLGWGWMSLLAHNIHLETQPRVSKIYVPIGRFCTLRFTPIANITSQHKK